MANFLLLLSIGQLLLLLLPAAFGEPTCEIPCGPNADCIAENRCQCRPLYESAICEDTGLPCCRPICQMPCMEFAACVAPDVCECVPGYRLQGLECKPRCSSGCPHGYCLAPEVCECEAGYESVAGLCRLLRPEGDGNEEEICESGFIWDKELEVCVPQTKYMTTTTTTTSTTSTTPRTTGAEESEKSSMPDDTTDVNLRSSEGSTDDKDIDGSVHHSTELPWEIDLRCPRGFTFHNGLCRPRIITDLDCNLEVCGPNTHCVDFGKCDCLTGFSWKFVDEGRSLRCLAMEEENEADRPDKVAKEPYSGWMGGLITALGVSCVVFALFFLIVFLYKSHKY